MKAPTVGFVEEELKELASRATEREVAFSFEEIGSSREGRPLFGVVAGKGRTRVTITAGAHADEPAGPLAALSVLRSLVDTRSGREILEKSTWRVCPHVNPDGAERNAVWFSEPADLEAYTRHVVRELPGEDVEFNYPDFDRPDALPRPENLAVAEFLAGSAPVHLHASLHGMAFSEGAWWLIGADWKERSALLRHELSNLFVKKKIGFHDIDRDGQKGFTRLERGFATTPTAKAMQAFFVQEGDTETAALFLPSSMEYVQSLGGDPLVMVSEIPIFRLMGGGPLGDPPGPDTPYLRFRPRYNEAKEQLRNGDPLPLRALAKEFDVRPVPFKLQTEIIRVGVFLAFDFVRSTQSGDEDDDDDE